MGATEIAQNSLNAVVELFKRGDLPQLLGETLATFPGDPRPMRRWSVSNQVIAHIFSTGDARGYRQWLQVGRAVKKGCKAFYILAPMVKTITKTDKETGEEKQLTLATGFRGVPVFRIEDTEIIDEAKWKAHEAAKPPELPPLKYQEVADKLGIKVSAGWFNKHAYGWYDRTEGKAKEIVLSSPEQTVWFHELAHAIDHKLNPKEFGSGGLAEELIIGEDKKAEREAVAEMAAATMAYINGYRVEEMSFAKAYVENYLGKKGWERKVLGLMNRIGEIVSFAINGEEAKNEQTNEAIA